MKAIDLTGQRFGMLTVIRKTEKRQGKEKRALWECRCDCGATALCLLGNLRHGLSTSCGCVRTKHNGKGTRLYRIWAGLKNRCLDPGSKYFKRYGGRGITVYEIWIHDFTAFRDWAFSHGYQEDLTIDRKDNNGPYSPDNCQWLTREENSRKSNRL